MASAHLSALTVLICALALILYNTPADAQGDLALDCCLKVSSKTIPQAAVRSYKIQVRGDGCPLEAVIFTTRKGFKLCAPPASETEWVGVLTRFIDNRLKKCKEIKFRGKRCEGLKTKSF